MTFGAKQVGEFTLQAQCRKCSANTEPWSHEYYLQGVQSRRTCQAGVSALMASKRHRTVNRSHPHQRPSHPPPIPAPLAHNPHPPCAPRSSLGLVQTQVLKSGGQKFASGAHRDPIGPQISSLSEGQGTGAPPLRTPPPPLVHPRAVLGQLHLTAPC